VALLSCVILSVPVPIWQCSVVSFDQSLYEYRRSLMCYTVSAIQMCQCDVLRYCDFLYECDNDVFCDNLNACTNLAVLSCVIFAWPIQLFSAV